MLYWYLVRGTRSGSTAGALKVLAPQLVQYCTVHVVSPFCVTAPSTSWDARTFGIRLYGAVKTCVIHLSRSISARCLPNLRVQRHDSPRKG